MMGGEGLTQATRVAILNANYIATRLEGAFDVLYQRPKRAAWRMSVFIDVRPFEKSAGVTVEDIAKRLIDAGFHAPTMSWPVAGTLMVEPTESRRPRPSLTVSAMRCWRSAKRSATIEAKADMDREVNPLKLAPHTDGTTSCATGIRPYSREQGVFSAGRVSGSTNIGRRSTGSITPMATAIWSAPARRWRIMPKRRSDPSRRKTNGAAFRRAALFVGAEKT